MIPYYGYYKLNRAESSWWAVQFIRNRSGINFDISDY